MKKRWLAALIVPAVLMTAGLAEEELPAAGEWYTDLGDATLRLSLEEEGSYTLHLPGAPEQSGDWTEEDSLVQMDGWSGLVLTEEDTLYWPEAELFFTREEPETYVPGEPIAVAEEADLDGDWICVWTDMDGIPVAASAAGDETKLRIDGTEVLLGGPEFGDETVQMTRGKGTLTWEDAGRTVELTMLDDGMLRMTVRTDEDRTTIRYLAPDQEEEQEAT